MASQQQFEGHLSELCDKAELLSSTLDQEADQRRKSEDEVSTLQSRLEEANAELQSLIKCTTKQENVLNQQLEELRRDVALGQKDLEASRLVEVYLEIKVYRIVQYTDIHMYSCCMCTMYIMVLCYYNWLV